MWEDSSLYPITAGVPQGGVWSPMLFNLYVHHLPSQLKSYLLVSYADNSTLLKVIPTKDLRLSAEQIFVVLLIGGEDDTLNLNPQSLMPYVFLSSVMLRSILPYL